MSNRFLNPIGGLLTAVAVIGLTPSVSLRAAPVRLSFPPNAYNAGSGVLPVQSRPYGLTYSEWSARWWQWAFSLSIDHSPLFGKADCGTGQSGPVWFLPGATVGGPTPRQNCTVPPGKALFVSIINAECSDLEGSGTTEGE